MALWNLPPPEELSQPLLVKDVVQESQRQSPLDRFGDLQIDTVCFQCDGNRPSCHSCASHGYQCTYVAAQGQTRVQALRSDNESLRGRLESLVSLS